MPNKTFIANFTRGAVASAVATCLVAETHAEIPRLSPLTPDAVVTSNASAGTEDVNQSTEGGSVMMTLREIPKQWTKRMEREFRNLALKEATGKLSSGDMKRITELNTWRERFVSPPPPEEVLLQLKRDRILAKISENLKEYVRFQEGANRSRSTPK